MANDRKYLSAVLITEEAMQPPSRKQKPGVVEMESTYRARWPIGPRVVSAPTGTPDHAGWFVESYAER